MYIFQRPALAEEYNKSHIPQNEAINSSGHMWPQNMLEAQSPAFICF